MAAVGTIGIFASNADSYTWAADGETTLSTTFTTAGTTLGEIEYSRQSNVEVGLWSLFIKATSGSSLTITPYLYFLIDGFNSVYSTVAHPVNGYSVASPSTKVTTFNANGGSVFEANLGAWQSFWLYSDGFKIDITRSSIDHYRCPTKITHMIWTTFAIKYDIPINPAI
jgi:hypothetical protein